MPAELLSGAKFRCPQETYMLTIVASQNTFIYALVDPRDKRIRYVGKSNTPKRRLNHHLHDNWVCHRTNWIKQLLGIGLSPQLIILEEVEQRIWKERECFWISLLRANGFNLVNSTEGGDGLENPSEEVRHKISVANIGRPSSRKGKKNSAETRKKISEAMKGKQLWLGRKHTPETIEKLSVWHRGRKVSEETKKKMSASHMGNKSALGYKHSDETKEKVKKAVTGRMHSDETKAKMSAARKGIVYSEETIKKMSDAKKGKKMSDEAKRNMSKAHKRHKDTIKEELPQQADMFVGVYNADTSKVVEWGHI